MLSTIVCCEDRPEAEEGASLPEILARTLASLVTAKVEGLLADVNIAGPAGAGLIVVANHAGCGLMEGKTEADWLRLGLQAARGTRIFLLRCGFAPEAGFIEEAAELLRAHANDELPAAALRAQPESFLERLLPSLAPVAGLIGSRTRMLHETHGGFEQLARRIACSVTFHTRARRIG